MANLTTDQMVVVATVFQESYAHVLSNSIEDTKIDRMRFVAGIVLQEKPYLLVTEEGIQRLISLVFADERNRDFIFTLSYTFFSRWGEDDLSVKGLAENLARGVSQASAIYGANQDINAIPHEIAIRLTPNNVAKDLIESNKWLMIILLLQLFIAASPT